MLKLAIIGCGYVAYYYLISMMNYRDLQIVGLYDRNPEKSRKLGVMFKSEVYSTIEDCINCDCDFVLNLTTPDHFEINKMILTAGKNLFCEKPITLSVKDFDELVCIAYDKNLKIISAPANYLSSYYHILKEHLSSIGNLKKVVATISEKGIPYHTLQNPLGSIWPIKSELETGCNLEHAGYILSLLTELFGDVKEIVKSSKGLTEVVKKYGDKNYSTLTPDTYRTEMIIGDVNCIMINSINYDNKKSVVFHGEKGKLVLENIWDFNSNIYLNDKMIEREKENFKQSWVLYMDLMRPLAYFEKEKKLPMTMQRLRNILKTMLEIQDM